MITEDPARLRQPSLVRVMYEDNILRITARPPKPRSRIKTRYALCCPNAVMHGETSDVRLSAHSQCQFPVEGGEVFQMA